MEGTIVLSTYLTKKGDPQRNKVYLPNNHDLIRPFYESAIESGVIDQMVVIHDELSAEFRRHYPKIEFIKIKDYKHSANDARFNLFYKLLYSTYLNVKDEDKDRFVWILDLFDVQIGKQLPNSHYLERKLYVSTEEDVWNMSNPWVRHIFERGYGKRLHPKLMGKKIYNAGVWGGPLKLVMEVMKLAKDEFKRMQVGDKNCNMLVFNKILYEKIGEENIITGYPLHTKFKANEKITTEWFKHK